MLEAYLLGNGGMAPLPGRFLSSLLVRYQGKAILFDCGEGTQVAIRSAGQGVRQIAMICLTHLHADHVAGLPGLLLTIGNSGRTEPLTVLGPPYVREVVRCLRVIAPQLPYEVVCEEVPGEGGVVFREGDLSLSALPVEHAIPCFAWRVDVSRKGRFHPERAKALEVPASDWRRLQNGEAVQVGDRTVIPQEVMGEERRGLRLCYATDLRPTPDMAGFAKGADLFICEGMYGSPEMRSQAEERGHCLFGEAAKMAADAGAEELWLTHFSPSVPRPEEYVGEASKIFPHVHVDRRSVHLRFRDGN